eukprot:CAMPEP_0115180068 /NCGR_PEP_ID=MMETSP0270-20121206/6731_1 /TAXON_ID=71861 /ORGANISM="Scrippsiella trochoidea, Strain CCMP3099" /LENGTH=147 /DNA_ID=CAMNT_0002593061 /DNA_START=405 /DNA_END=845 /DNA_ORIENTATION=-
MKEKQPEPRHCARDLGEWDKTALDPAKSRRIAASLQVLPDSTHWIPVCTTSEHVAEDLCPVEAAARRERRMRGVEGRHGGSNHRQVDAGGDDAHGLCEAGVQQPGALVAVGFLLRARILLARRHGITYEGGEVHVGPGRGADGEDGA